MLGTSPKLGLCPNTPQNEAGIRIEPPMSVPISNEVSPAATAAAAPPDDPPGTRSAFHGFTVVPNIGLKAWTSPDQRGRFVLPNTIAPAAFSAATVGASCCGTCSASSVAPPVERMPAVWSASLIVIESPCNGPTASPRLSAASAASAAALADSKSSVTIAFSAGLMRSNRSRWSPSSSRLLSSPLRIAAACRVADQSAGSSDTGILRRYRTGA